MRRWALAMMLVIARPVGAADTISWEVADKHVGEEVVVEGRVLGVHCSPTSCLLAFDPTFNRFTVVVQASKFKIFPPNTLDATFSGRQVRVHGTIKEVAKKPEIEISTPEDLQLVVTERERAEEKSTEHDEALDRIDGILDRIEDLTDRLADAQDRLEQLALVLDQRAEQLAALQASQLPPPLPPEPSYGEPQPRPGYEALRSVKRGMSRYDVERLVGQPLTIEGAGGNGSATWFYGYGRSVTFDHRGRVKSLVGFPNP